jgi:hypothetical protein
LSGRRPYSLFGASAFTDNTRTGQPSGWPHREPAVIDRGWPPRPGPRSLGRAVAQRRSRIQPSTSRRARSAYAAASDRSSGCLPDRLLGPSEHLRSLLIGPDAVDDEAPRNPTPMRSVPTHLPAPTSEACSRHILSGPRSGSRFSPMSGHHETWNPTDCWRRSSSRSLRLLTVLVVSGSAVDASTMPAMMKKATV